MSRDLLVYIIYRYASIIAYVLFSTIMHHRNYAGVRLLENLWRQPKPKKSGLVHNGRGTISPAASWRIVFTIIYQPRPQASPVCLNFQHTWRIGEMRERERKETGGPWGGGGVEVESILKWFVSKLIRFNFWICWEILEMFFSFITCSVSYAQRKYVFRWKFESTFFCNV